MPQNPFDQVLDGFSTQFDAPVTNPFDAALDDLTEKRQGTLVQNDLKLGSTTPDARAEALRLGKIYGAPPELVERNLEEFQKRDRQDKLKLLSQQNPKLADWLGNNASNQALAQDDTERLQRIDNAVTFGGSILRGWDNVQSMTGRFVEAAGEAVGSQQLSEWGRKTGEFNEAQSAGLGPKQSFQKIGSIWDLTQWVKETAGEQIPIMAPMLAGGATGAAIGSVVPGVGTTIGGIVGAFFPSLVLGVGETQQNIKQTDPNAVAPGWAFLGGSAVAAFDSALPGHMGARLVRLFGTETAEAIARRTLMATVKPVLIRSVSSTGMQAMATEGLTEALQEAIGAVAAAKGTNTQVNWDQTFSQMLEAGAAGALMGGLTGGTEAVLEHQTEVAKYAVSQQQKLFFDAIATAAQDSTLAKRDPGAFADAVKHLTKDGPVENVYVPTEEFTTYFQSKGVSPDAVAAQLTGKSSSLEDAVAAGTKLRIPTSAYASMLAASEHAGFFAKEVSLAPEGLNAREAAEAKTVLEQQAKTIADAVAQAQTATAPAELTPLAATISTALQGNQQFIAAVAKDGVDPATAASHYAVGVEAVFTQLGKRFGADPAELFNRYGLSIGSQGVTVGGSLATSLGAVDPAATAAQEPALEQPLEVVQGTVTEQPDGTPSPAPAEGTTTLDQGPRKRTPPKEPPHLAKAPGAVVDGRLRVSTRVPTAKQAETSTESLRTDLAAAEAIVPKLAAVISDYPQAAAPKGASDAEVLETFITRVVHNLRFLWNSTPADLRDRAKLWYVGAHRIMQDMADEHGIADRQAAGVFAVLSPQMDWFKNVALGRRVAAIFTRAEQENPVFSPELMAHYIARAKASLKDRENQIRKRAGDAAALAYRKSKLQELKGHQQVFEGRSWHDIGIDGQARMLRAIDETQNTRAYPVILPEGEDGETVLTKKGQPAQLAWGAYGAIENAISIMRDGSVENISRTLGGEHKVRSFFNNISDPWNPDAVTIDTHAVAAALLEALSGASHQVIYTMNGPADAASGTSGANAVYAEAYFRLSAELGVLPRELQSVTWEAVRGLFDPAGKRADMPALALDLWKQFEGGKITEEELYERLVTTAGGLGRPAWADTPPRVALDEGQLRQGDVQPLRPDVSSGRRGASVGASRPAGQAAELRDGPVVPDPAPLGLPARRTAVTRALGRLSSQSARSFEGTRSSPAQRVRGVARTFTINATLEQELRRSGYTVHDLVELEPTKKTAKFFRDKLLASKAAGTFGAAVYVYDLADYEAMRIFVTNESVKDGLGRSGGFAIKPDGDIVSVWSTGGGLAHSMLALAVQEGGTKLDNFDTMLSDIYAVNGFKVVKREAWNEAFKPTGWDKQTFAEFNNGEPDVVFMEYDPAALETGPITLYQSEPALPMREWAYSRLERAAELSNMKKGTGEQWKGVLKNSKIGIAQDEFLYAHVDDLESGTIYTKAEVLAYLQQNKLTVNWTTLDEGNGKITRAEITARAEEVYEELANEAVSQAEDEGFGPELVPEPEARFNEEQGQWEVFLGDESIGLWYDTEEAALAYGFEQATKFDEQNEREWRRAVANDSKLVSYKAAEAIAEERILEEKNLQVPQFEDYTLAGGEPGTYREVLLQAPVQSTPTGYASLSQIENNRLKEGMAPELRAIKTAVDLGPEQAVAMFDKLLADYAELTLKIDRALATGDKSYSAYDLTRVQNDRRIIAKLKASEDWTFHTSRNWVDGHNEYNHIPNPIVRVRYDKRVLASGQTVLFIQELQAPRESQFGKMPPLLQKNWRELGMKWALAKAVEEHVDAIAWTSGQQQTERYKISAVVNKVRWNTLDDQAVAYDQGHRYSVALEQKALGPTIRLRLDAELKVVNVDNASVHLREDLIGQPIDRLIGKDLARQLADSHSGEVNGEDIVVGGEGLRRLYDQDMGNVLNKLAPMKKSGVKVGTVTVATGEERGMPVPARLIGNAEAIAQWEAEHPGVLQTADVPGVLLTPEVRSHVAEGQALFQREQTTRRGSISWDSRRQFRIELFKDADLSTFLHETGHFYLEVLGDLVQELQGRDPSTLEFGQQGLLDDYEKILRYLGVSSRSEVGEAQHELFARSFEAYLREGRAPTPQLNGAFARYRSWLVAIYRRATKLQVNLTDDVRNVFDRLLAGDDAVARAETQMRQPPMFTNAADAGMTDIEWRAYEETVRDASEQARSALQQRLMQELQREREQWWKSRRKEVQAQVQKEVSERPAYVALAALQRNERPDGTPMEGGPLKLSKDSIVTRYGKDRLAQLPKPWVYALEDGIDVEQAAELFGFTSGDDLLTTLATTPRIETSVAKETDARMKSEFGDMRIDGTLAVEAKRVVMEHGHEAVIQMELAALKRKRAEVAPFLAAQAAAQGAEEASGKRAVNKALSQAAELPLDAVRQIADRNVAELVIRDIRPGEFWAAAQSSGREALKAATAGNYERAVEQKAAQRMALEMYRAATAAQEETRKALQFAKRFDSPAVRKALGKAGASYLQQVDSILEKFEFKPVSNRELGRRASLRAWVEQQQQEGLMIDPDATDAIDAAQPTNYKELTLQQLRDVRDTVRQITALARLKNKLLKAQDARSFTQRRDEAVARIRAQAKPGTKLPLEFGAKEERVRRIGDWFASHMKIATIARHLDGHVDGGPVWDLLIRPLNQAAAEKADRNRKAGQQLADILTKHYPGREQTQLGRKLFIPMIGASLSKEARLVLALTAGNETGLDRIKADPRRRFTEAQLAAILDTLDRRDWLFVQDVWSYLDSFWPEVAALEKRVVGLEPERVVPRQVQTKFGTFAGGYYPLGYDRRMAAAPGANDAVSEAKLQMAAAYVRTTTRHGHTQARLDNVQLPLRLDFSTMFSHVDQVVHDLTHREALIDVSRMLRDKEFSQAIIDTTSDVTYEQFTSAMQAIAVDGKIANQNVLDRAATFARTGTQIAALGLNLWTAMQQPLGLFNGMQRVGPTWVLRGMRKWLVNAATMENTMTWIQDRSVLMRQRHLTSTQDMADLRNKLAQPGGWFDDLVRTVTADKLTQQAITDAMLWHIGLAQRVADVPTWLGAYEKAMAEGNNEERSSALADQAVLDSQGGGDVKDLAKVQRGGPMAKLWMQFYSYGNTVYNATADSYGRTKFTSPTSVAKFLGDLALLYVMPALGTVALAHATGRKGSDDDDDWQKWVLEVGGEALSTAMNTMVFVREFGQLFGEGTRGYAGPAGARAIQTIYGLVNQVKQGEADEALFTALAQTTGMLFRLPALQAQKTIDGWIALEEGRTKNPAVLLTGAPKE